MKLFFEILRLSILARLNTHYLEIIFYPISNPIFVYLNDFLSISSHSLIGQKMVTCSGGTRFTRNDREGSKSNEIKTTWFWLDYEPEIHEPSDPNSSEIFKILMVLVWSEIQKSCSVLVRHDPKICLVLVRPVLWKVSFFGPGLNHSVRNQFVVANLWVSLYDSSGS